ncbi:MAG: aldo/keto reductase [Chromatiales bacterium]|jgi:diketogulonate reductase-like aldo/keto reductase|nr:aldo/keto reductase [Chromatiales bacterium]
MSFDGVPKIGQGTWEMEHDANPVVAIRRGLDKGLTHVDTAEMYGSGAVERLVGEALFERRDEVFLVSKVLPFNASRQGTIAACERSLKALRTDRLDAYLLHWPGSEPLEETVAGFEALKDAGKILAYGVSNFDVPDLEAFVAVAGVENVACNQVLYHPGERTAENCVIPWCRARGVPVVAYSPFGHGPISAQPGAVTHALAAVAAETGASAHQVALQFVTRGDGVLTIPKASQIAHVDDNAAAQALSLTAAQLSLLEACLPRNVKQRRLPML